MKEIAILGPTASGKTALSIKLAHQCNAIILSLDSLSLYKEINIASAKPTKIEMDNIIHFGIDELNINDYFNSALYFKLYQKAKKYAKEKNKNLIIVGGTSFYLKSLYNGLSKKPIITSDIKEKIKKIIKNKEKAYAFLVKTDFKYANKITKNDSYRIEKWYEIYFSTNLTASDYFLKNKKEKVINKIKIFEIDIKRDYLKEKIKLRTNQMIKNGLIDEVFYLEKKYTRIPKPMSSIGIKETIEYLDGYINLHELQTKITNKTFQLAKRQVTFNKTQFNNITKRDIKTLESLIQSYLQNN